MVATIICQSWGRWDIIWRGASINGMIVYGTYDHVPILNAILHISEIIVNNGIMVYGYYDNVSMVDHVLILGTI